MRKLLALTTLILVMFYAHAQPPLGLPSPNNAFLGGGGGGAEVGVDVYTGTAQVSIPIATAQGKDLAIPVSLNYTGGMGIRVQDYASNVGLGWQLSAGGSITRVVRGLPDDSGNGYLGHNTSSGAWATYLADWGYNETPLPTQISGGTLGLPSVDSEPDLYHIRTPFFSVQFVFDENREAVFSNNTGLKITAHMFYGSSPSPQGYGFTVIDEHGNRYLFGGAAPFTESISTTLRDGNYTYVSAWYLNQITSVNNKESIFFSYVSSPSNSVLTHYSSSQTSVGGVWQSVEDESNTTTVNQPKLLSRIQTSISEIGFSYSYDRLDIPNAGRLTSIAVRSRTGTSTTKLLRTYQFDYSYFGAPSSNPDLLRLRLDKIRLLAGDNLMDGEQQYKNFRYYDQEELPTRRTDQFDFWGYYTFISVVTPPLWNPSVRTPNLDMARAGILTTIEDLGGGTTIINYELNTYLKVSTNTNVSVGGLRVKSIARSDPGGQTLTTSYDYNDAQGKSSGQVSTESFSNLTAEMIHNGGLVRKNFSESISNIYGLNGSFIGYSSVKTLYPTGGYSISTFTNHSDFPDGTSNWSANYTSSNRPPNVAGVISAAYKRGLPKTEIVYSASGNKLAENIYQYAAVHSVWDDPIRKKSFAYQRFRVRFKWTGNTHDRIITYSYWTQVENYRLVKTTRREYDQVNIANYLETITDYTYTPNGYYLVRTAASTDSKGNSRTKTTFYSVDLVMNLPELPPDNYEANLSMRHANWMTAIVSVETSNNGKAERIENTYRRVAGTSPIKVRLTSTENQSAGILVNKNMLTYDGNENVVTTKSQYGIPTTVIYSYNNTYPIAEIQNADYATVVAALGGQTAVNNFAANYAPTAAQVTTFLAPLRTATSLAGALVSTYAYESGVGIVSKTDPLGKKITYEYDGLQRLVRIKDHNEKVIEDYQYNYKPNY